MSSKNVLISTNYFFKNQKGFYRGKVRDVYNISEKFLVVVSCDRLSAFDHVMPHPIPYKGQVLNQIAAHFLTATADEIPNWKIATPDPNVTIGHKCDAFPVEIVIRGYLAGHAWREYRDGKRVICGVKLPDGLKESDKLKEPIITPTIKAKTGHDEDISLAQIVKEKMVSKEDLDVIVDYTKKLYQLGTKTANNRGLILVDTKYEFGKNKDQIMLIDEIHTPDSSRYFYLDEYEARQEKGQAQKQLSKEFVRQWLIENGFQGLPGQKVPEMDDNFIESIVTRYTELYQKITNTPFEKRSYDNILEEIENNITNYLISESII